MSKHSTDEGASRVDHVVVDKRKIHKQEAAAAKQAAYKLRDNRGKPQRCRAFGHDGGSVGSIMQGANLLLVGWFLKGPPPFVCSARGTTTSHAL